MATLVKTLGALKEQLEIPCEALDRIAGDFQREMAEGLSGRTGSLMMLPSYLSNPTGGEKGKYIALDFGGTNVRVLLIVLLGNGRYEVAKRVSFRLKDNAKGYDYTSATSKAEELFGFIARNIAAVAEPGEVYPLGHTFSFGCHQTGVNRAVLITWTKEIKTPGVEGVDVGELLEEALKREHVANVIPKAILNDTVGTQLAGAYTDRDCDIASILGTGHNTCYLENNPPWTATPVIVNMESGNFNKVPQTRYDRLVDAASERPGAQLLEKMVAGRYLGELVRMIIQQLMHDGLLFKGCNAQLLGQKDRFTGEEMSRVLSDNTGELSGIDALLKERFLLSNTRAEDRAALKTVCANVMNRSARLVAGTYLGVLRHIDPELSRRHSIAVDGSLFEKMPGYAEALAEALQSVLGEKAGRVTLKLTKDGSGVGAAIAAALVQ